MTTTYSFFPSDIGSVTSSDSIGDVQHVQISLNSNIVDDLRWINDYRAKIDRENKMRETNPALKNTWDSYQTMLAIVMDDV